MKTLYPVFLILMFMDHTLQAQSFQTADDSLAYSLGVLIGNNLRQEGFGDLNSDLIHAGLKAAMRGEPTLMSVDACNSVMQEHSTKRKMKQHEANKTAGEQFLAANKNKPGIISLDSGLQYEILQAADGPKPKATDKVRVHYHGTLIDGTVFDSSVERGEPISFALNQVISGWTEAVQLMPVGSTWRVFIPYHLAYGERGAGPTIQPYSALIFDIELLGIE